MVESTACRGGQKSGGSDLAPPARIADCAARAARRLQSGGADPAGLGDVHRHAVGPGVLHLDVAVPIAVLPDAEGLVDVLAGLGSGILQPLGDRLQALDLEADVVDAAPARTALDTGDRVVLE